MRTPLLPTFCAALILMSALACSWSDEQEEILDVTYEEDFDTDIPINADALCPAGTDCSATSAPAPVDTELQPIDVSVDIDIVEQTGQQKLADYAGKFKSIQVTKIEYEAVENNLSFDLPAFTLYTGPVGTEETDAAGTYALATIPVIPAGVSAKGEGVVNAANVQEVSALIQSLRLALLAKATPVVKQGQPLPPTGKTTLKIVVYVKFVANPADIARKVSQ